MTHTLACALDEPRPLDDAASEHTLRRAIAEAAPVRVLVSNGVAEHAAGGTVSGGDDATLTLRMERPIPWEQPLPASACLHVTLELDDGPCFFESRCVSSGKKSDPDCIVIRRPAALAVIDRRRVARKVLREPSELTLNLRGSDTPWHCKATMLNVSPDGLACRVSAEDAQRLPRGTAVRAVFHVEGDSQPFDLVCRVTNCTPGGSPHSVVLGMAFLENENPAMTRKRISLALRHSGGSAARTSNS